MEEMAGRLKERLGDTFLLEQRDIPGINGTMRPSFFVKEGNSPASRGIRIDSYYKRYQAGAGMDALAEEILGRCREEATFPEKEIQKLSCWESIKGHIFPKLVNTGKNATLLMDAPHREFLDLSMVYYARIGTDCRETCGTLLILGSHMRHWGIREESLHQAAWKNLNREDKAVFEDLASLLGAYAGPSLGHGASDIPKMYVLGSSSRQNGAVQVCCQRLLKEIAGELNDDFWILPSSIHETLLIPVGHARDAAQELAEIVRQVNTSQLMPEEFLSGHVYHYRRDSGKLSIAA